MVIVARSEVPELFYVSITWWDWITLWRKGHGDLAFKAADRVGYASALQTQSEIIAVLAMTEQLDERDS